MEDFNNYAQNDFSEQSNGGLFELVNSLAKKFDGKNQNELLKAIYVEAQKGKRNGTLTNEQLETFANMLSPALDEKKKKILFKVVEELKKI